jgi:hypothetical protein
VIAFGYPAFTKFTLQLKIKNLPWALFIRLINFVDDITTTLRRIQASLPGVDAEERKRLAESLRAAGNRIADLLQEVEKTK